MKNYLQRQSSRLQNKIDLEELCARLHYFSGLFADRWQMHRNRLLQPRQGKPALSSGVSCSFQELLQLRKEVDALLFNPPNTRPQENASQFISALRGRGLEFDTARYYQFGDEVRHIDWRVTARTLKTHVKVYHEERERAVCFLVDHSDSMHFGTRQEFKSVRASKTAALLAWLAKALNEKIGGIVFSETQQCLLKPTAGDNGILPFLRALQLEGDRSTTPPSSDHASAPSASHTQPTLLQELQRFSHLTPRGSLCFVVSDFYALGDENEAIGQAFERELYELSQRCDLNILLIYDDFEAQALPTGRYRLSDGRALLELNDNHLAQRSIPLERFKQRMKWLDQLAHRTGFNAHAIATDSPLIEVVNSSLVAHAGQTNFQPLLEP